MTRPKIELTSEGVKHQFSVNGVNMNWVRKVTITIEGGAVAAMKLEYGESQDGDVTNIDPMHARLYK